MHLNVIIIQIAYPFILILNKHCGFIREFDDLAKSYISQINAGLEFRIYIPFFKRFIFFADCGIVHQNLISNTHQAFDLSMLCTVIALGFHSMDILEIYKFAYLMISFFI